MFVRMKHFWTYVCPTIFTTRCSRYCYGKSSRVSVCLTVRPSVTCNGGAKGGSGGHDPILGLAPSDPPFEFHGKIEIAGCRMKTVVIYSIHSTKIFTLRISTGLQRNLCKLAERFEGMSHILAYAGGHCMSCNAISSRQDNLRHCRWLAVCAASVGLQRLRHLWNETCKST